MYEHSVIELRRIEKCAFDNVIRQLKCSCTSDSTVSREMALNSAEELWLILLEDVVHPENILPPSLKAKLLSVGIWIIKECYALRMQNQRSLDQLIDISEIISDSLN